MPQCIFPAHLLSVGAVAFNELFTPRSTAFTPTQLLYLTMHICNLSPQWISPCYSETSLSIATLFHLREHFS